MFISATVPMPTRHVAFEILRPVSAFEGTACHGASEGSVVCFDVLTIIIHARYFVRPWSMRWREMMGLTCICAVLRLISGSADIEVVSL